MTQGRILLVGEDELFHQRLHGILEKERGLEIVGDCTSVEAALCQIDTLVPNIVLSEFWLSGMDRVIEACRRLTISGFACDVIILCGGQWPISNASATGAADYFYKDGKPEKIINAIRLACRLQLLMAKLETDYYRISSRDAILL